MVGLENRKKNHKKHKKNVLAMLGDVTSRWLSKYWQTKPKRSL